MTAPRTVLTLNPGSSSLKVAVRDPRPVIRILIERLGTDRGQFTVTAGEMRSERPLTGDVAEAVAAVATELSTAGVPVNAVAHRVVHGGPRHYAPTVLDDSVLDDLVAAIPLAPLHLPGNIDAIRQARRLWPDIPQVACFDTGFHHDLPESSRRLPVPDELVDLGIRRYGFHGLSVQSVLQARPDIDDVVIAHLGSGCSATAVSAGRPRHTSMSLTPTSGMVSATRTGDLDPEIALYLIEQHGYTVGELRDVFDHSSGLAGIAQGRHDVRDLQSAQDPSAGLALDIFARSAAMAIAGAATSLDRWTTLVFTGGVGEHAEGVRAAICARLLPLRGLVAEPASSAQERLSLAGVQVLVVPADEETILDAVARELLNH